MKNFWQSSSRYRIILIFAVLGLVFLLVPIQRYITIDRPQHHAMSFSIFAFGCLLQTALSWRHLSGWGRASYLSTSSYFLALALTLFFNPWLDTTVSIAPSGEEPLLTRNVLLGLSVLFIVGQLFVWSKWVREEIACAESQEAANAKLQETEEST